MAALGALCGGIARSSSALTHDDRVDAVAGAVAHFQRAMMMDVNQAAKAMRDEEALAEIEDFLRGLQPADLPAACGSTASGSLPGHPSMDGPGTAGPRPSGWRPGDPRST